MTKITFNKVIVYYVHNIELLRALIQELHRRLVARYHLPLFILILLVDHRPSVREDVQCLIFPDHEGFSVHDCRLNHFLAVEDAPGDGVDLIVTYVLQFLAFFVDGLIGNVRKLIQVSAEVLDDAGVDEELEVSFLVNYTVIRAPSVFLIR